MYLGSRESRLEFDARVIERSGEFKVLRKLRPIQDLIADESVDAYVQRLFMRSNREPGEYKAVFIDTETTGLNVEEADAIEVGAIALAYDLREGVFTKFLGSVSMLEDPRYPIPKEVSVVHGIFDEDVRGQTFDDARLLELCDGAHVIVAHNAKFDRPFLEKRFPFFKNLPFACSLAQIPWKEEGYGSGMLEFIAMRRGFFYEAHRAETDCHALASCLVEKLEVSGKWPMEILHDAATQDDFIVFACGAPYESRELLKSKRFKWAPDRKAWFREVPSQLELEELLEWLEKQVYQGDSWRAQCFVREAVSRFSSNPVIKPLGQSCHFQL